MKFVPGTMIRFTYNHQSVDNQTGEKFKEILVLHPNWGNKVHGVDLKRLSPAERKVLEIVLDPKQKDIPSNIPLVNSIKRRMDPIKDIHNPMPFYVKFVKPFLNGKDAYRTYIPKLMLNVTVLKDFSIATGRKPVSNPLFGNKPAVPAAVGPVSQTKPLNAIDLMAQNAKNRGLK